MTDRELVAAAIDATKRAYAPYSGFFVGAALLADNGKVYIGCNIENSSFSATNCAERPALFTAIADGARKFTAIAIAGGKGGEIGSPCPPCGVCRQALSEFCGKDFKVLLAKKDGYDEYTLGELLPQSFEF